MINSDCRNQIHVIGVAVVSADGFIGNSPSHSTKDWASKEDWEFLQSHLNQGGLCVMGRTTHELYPNTKGRDRLVFTSTANTIQSIENNTYLCNASAIGAEEVVKHLSSLSSNKNVFVLGGSKIYQYFLNYIGFDQFDLSIEQNITMNRGVPLFSDPEPLDKIVERLTVSGLIAESALKLNDTGSVVKSFKKENPSSLLKRE